MLEDMFTENANVRVGSERQAGSVGHDPQWIGVPPQAIRIHVNADESSECEAGPNAQGVSPGPQVEPKTMSPRASTHEVQIGLVGATIAGKPLQVSRINTR